MHTRIRGHFRDLEKIVKANPALQRIVDADFDGEINPPCVTIFKIVRS